MQNEYHAMSAATPEVASAEQAASHTDVLTALLNRPPTRDPALQAGDIAIGTLCALGDDGQPLVAWPAGPSGPMTPVPAASLAPVIAADVGRSVALGFAASTGQPLILGFVWQPAAPPSHIEVKAEVDGRHLEITAEESITLRCGQASLTLTADGQVLLRGTYVSSHSSGTQRIKGAAVRIN